MREFLAKPWLHFLLLGFFLFIGNNLFNGAEQFSVTSPSASRTVQLKELWQHGAGRDPSQQELQQLIDKEIDEEMLFQEALSYQWHLRDNLIRQRLIVNMRFLNVGDQSAATLYSSLPPSPLSSSASSADALRKEAADALRKENVDESLQAGSVRNDAESEMLFQQALELSLHKNDLVVRRRLIQLMEKSAHATSSTEAPADDVLLLLYEQGVLAAHKHLNEGAALEQGVESDFFKPPQFNLQHVFISRDRIINQAAPNVSLSLQDAQQLAYQRAEKTLATLQLEKIAPADALSYSDAFLNGYQFETLSTVELARYFGDNFSRELSEYFESIKQKDNAKGAMPSLLYQWVGPVPSVYGYHLIWFDKIHSPKVKTFLEMKPKLMSQWRKQQEGLALLALKRKLRAKYQVVEAQQ